MALEHDSDTLIARLVREAGSQTAFGAMVGKRQSVISGWLKAGRVAHTGVIAVEAATGVTRYDLRPDLYPREAPTAPAAPARFEASR